MANDERVGLALSAGLKRALQRRVVREGLSESAVIRRAIMHELNVDAEGQPCGDRTV